MTTRILIALCTFSFAVAAGAQEGEISWKSTEVVPGLYMLEGQGGFAGGNITLVSS